MKHFLLLIVCLIRYATHAGAQDVTSGLILHYPLDEQGGTTAREHISGKNGTLVNAPAWIGPGLSFDGDQSVTTSADTGNGITDNLTLAVWVRLDAYFTRNGYPWQGIVAKACCGSPIAWRLTLDEGDPIFHWGFFGVVGGNGFGQIGQAYGGNRLGLGQWQHIAVTSGGGFIRLFVNGAKRSEIAQNVIFGATTGGLTLGMETGFDSFGLRGDMRDVRVYNRALSEAEVAVLTEVSFFGPYTGLWIGEVTLNEVKQAADGAWSATPAAFSERVILHVDESGRGRFLKEATLMKTRAAPPVSVVVAAPELIPNYDGITPRGGRLVGQRFSSSTFAIPAESLSATRSGFTLQGTFSQTATQASNPFRHKYHPDLSVGRTLQRSVTLRLSESDSPSDHTITGTFSESITGLHKSTLEARGPVTFTRVSTSGKLIQP